MGRAQTPYEEDPMTGVTRRTAFLALGGLAAALPALPNAAAAPNSRRSQALGVTFFGASWCPYCHGAATVLKAFEEAGEIELLAISMDGRPIGVIANPQADQGEAAALGVSGVPVTVLFDPVSGRPAHIIRGFKGYGAFIAEFRAAARRIAQP